MDFLFRHNTHHVIEVFVSKRFHSDAKAAKKRFTVLQTWSLKSRLVFLKFKNKLKANEAATWQKKIKTSQSQLKIY